MASPIFTNHKQINPKGLFEKLNRSKLLVDDGIEFPDLPDFSAVYSMLGSVITFPEDISSYRCLAIARESISRTLKEDNTSFEKLERNIREAIGDYQSRSDQKFALATSLSIHFQTIIKSSKINDAHISISSSLAKKFHSEREGLISSVKHSIHCDYPKDYIEAKVIVHAKGDHEASEVALESLDLLRGIWNLALNYGRERFSSGKKIPVNNIILGPLHTLHTLNGKLASKIWWYEPDFVNPVKAKQNIDTKQMYSFEKDIRKLLSRMAEDHRAFIEEGVRRYCKALDHTDWSKSFWMLWGLFEYLTFSVKESYAVSIKRALVLIGDKEYHNQVLHYLCDRRNAYIHSNIEIIEEERSVHLLKRYIELLLINHMRIGSRVSSKSELEMLMSIANPEELNDKLKLYKKIFVTSF